MKAKVTEHVQAIRDHNEQKFYNIDLDSAILEQTEEDFYSNRDYSLTQQSVPQIDKSQSQATEITIV